MSKYLFIIGISLIISGCGVKDPSFYDLKSPCVSINVGNSSIDPCIRTSPQLNSLYELNEF